MVVQMVNGVFLSCNFSYFKMEDCEVGIVMQYCEEDCVMFDQLKMLFVLMIGCMLFLIGVFVDFEVGDGVKIIERENC